MYERAGASLDRESIRTFSRRDDEFGSEIGVYVLA